MSTDTDNNEDEPDTVRTSIEVDEEVWRELRATAVREGTQLSKQLEQVLREYFQIKEADTSNVE